MYEGSKILVTGASGLIGTHLVNLLLKMNAQVKAITHKRNVYFKKSDNVEIINGDLTSSEFCHKICTGVDYVFHLAVETGSIVKNAKFPASIMTPTILMDFNMLQAAHNAKVDRYLYSSCACVYPAHLDEMREENAWDGDPPEWHKTISWAKRISELQCQSFCKEYGDKIAIVRPSNAYGPYDEFDANNSHVISAFIKKAFTRSDPFVIWGNGEQIREFVYAEDIAKGMILALEKCVDTDHINLAGGTPIKIKDLARKIISEARYSPKIEFDTSKPTGHTRRVLNSEKAVSKLNFIPSTTLDEGLKKTILWYKDTYEGK